MQVGEDYEIEVRPKKGPGAFYSKARVVVHDPKGETVVKYNLTQAPDRFATADIISYSRIR